MSKDSEDDDHRRENEMAEAAGQEIGEESNFGTESELEDVNSMTNGGGDYGENEFADCEPKS